MSVVQKPLVLASFECSRSVSLCLIVTANQKTHKYFTLGLLLFQLNNNNNCFGGHSVLRMSIQIGMDKRISIYSS